MYLEENEAAIEAILFASGKPVYVKDIAETLEIEEENVLRLVNGLKNKYISEKRGINIVNVEDKIQMCTAAQYYDYIKKIIKNTQKRKTLTGKMLETLAIIAYKQPVTKTDIEKIRGVNSDQLVNKLVEYGLAEEKGRLNVVGKPIIFGTTDLFLTHFGFESISNLPKLPETDENMTFEAEKALLSEK